tara:strand:- start:21 stop:461 length:441 start_codon:yes stop_codon:yes gene_type:complete
MEYEPLISIIKSMINSLNETDGKVRRALRLSLRRTLQYYTDLLPKMVSVKADEYNKLNFNLDLQIISFDNSKKGELRLEHTTPLMSFVDYLTNLNPEEVEDEILNYSGCCWILKEEDKKLNDNGHSQKRPGGWKKCYEKAEIVLVA